jgi:hypothetical protein
MALFSRTASRYYSSQVILIALSHISLAVFKSWQMLVERILSRLFSATFSDSNINPQFSKHRSDPNVTESP